MSYVSDPLYDELNKTSDSGTKLSSAIMFERRYEAVLVDCILKNTHDILRKDLLHEIKLRPSGFSDKCSVANFGSDDYPFATIPSEEYSNMHELCKVINKRIAGKKSDRTYDWPNVWPIYGDGEEWIKSLDFDIYPNLTLKYNGRGSMTDFYPSIEKSPSIKLVSSPSTTQWDIEEFTLALPLRMKRII